MSLNAQDETSQMEKVRAMLKSLTPDERAALLGGGERKVEAKKVSAEQPARLGASIRMKRSRKASPG